jgi:hypothetical protein
MTYEARLQGAIEFETQVMEWLTRIGWLAFPFGQALLPPECRVRLKHFVDAAKRPSLLRWMPDIIAFRDYNEGRVSLALVDAKHCAPDRKNYAVEIAAIETAELFVEKLFTPVFFVFSDWRALTPRDARMRGYFNASAPGGSGTPFLLIDKRFGVSATEYFPAKPTRGVP